MQTSSRGRLALAAAATLTFAPASHAQADPRADEGALRYRQSLMEAVSGDMAALANLMKYRLTVPGAAAVHADGLAARAKLVALAFERKVTDGATDAEPGIWEKPAEFQQSIEKFQAETARLAEIAKGGDPLAVGEQIRATGKTCGGCHDTFRKPKEESFKRKGGGS
jgi:cytochrome c556